MSRLQNNFTTPEQSKRLLELGVPADSADFYFDRDEVEIDERPYPYFIPQNRTFTNYSIDFYIPCWSVGRLIEIIKICSTVNFYNIYKNTLFEWEDGESIIEGLIASMDVMCKQLDFSKLNE